MLAGEPIRRDHSISVIVVKSDPIWISPNSILLGIQPMGTFCQQKVIISTRREDPLRLIDHSTTEGDTLIENLGYEDGRIVIRIIQEIAGFGNQNREIFLKLGFGNKVFERKIIIKWYGQ